MRIDDIVSWYCGVLTNCVVNISVKQRLSKSLTDSILSIFKINHSLICQKNVPKTSDIIVIMISLACYGLTISADIPT
jgi:uncharacterized membrane protein YqgA involved in biofilm formation